MQERVGEEGDGGFKEEVGDEEGEEHYWGEVEEGAEGVVGCGGVVEEELG